MILITASNVYTENKVKIGAYVTLLSRQYVTSDIYKKISVLPEVESLLTITASEELRSIFTFSKPILISDE